MGLFQFSVAHAILRAASSLTRRLLRAGATSVGKSADAAGRSACATLLFGEEGGDIGGAGGFLGFAEADALQHLSVLVLAAGKVFGAFFEEGAELLARRSVGPAGPVLEEIVRTGPGGGDRYLLGRARPESADQQGERFPDVDSGVPHHVH